MLEWLLYVDLLQILAIPFFITINYLRVLIIFTTYLISSRMDVAATRIAELGQQGVMRAYSSSAP